MEKSAKQRALAPWRFPLNETVHIGVVTATLLAALAGLKASPATGEEPVRPADPSLAHPAGFEEQAAGSEEKRGHRPPPPPTLATFTGVVAVGRTRYTYTMVGSNPKSASRLRA